MLGKVLSLSLTFFPATIHHLPRYSVRSILLSSQARVTLVMSLLVILSWFLFRFVLDWYFGPVVGSKLVTDKTDLLNQRRDY